MSLPSLHKYVVIFRVNIIFTIVSFISLCQLSMFHMRFIKIRSLFSELLFFFIMPDPGCLITVLLSHYGVWISQVQITKTLIGLVQQMKNADRYIMACYIYSVFKRYRNILLKYEVVFLANFGQVTWFVFLTFVKLKLLLTFCKLLVSHKCNFYQLWASHTSLANQRVIESALFI